VGEVLEAVGMVARLKGKKPARRFDCLLQIKAAFRLWQSYSPATIVGMAAIMEDRGGNGDCML
jgi:hypothetical protein